MFNERAFKINYPKKESEMIEDNIQVTLKERGSRYGAFIGHARVTQRLKDVLRDELEQRKKHLSPSQQEALEMIFHKIGRVVNGDPDYIDSWVDMVGYPQLVVNELKENEEFRKITFAENQSKRNNAIK